VALAVWPRGPHGVLRRCFVRGDARRRGGPLGACRAQRSFVQAKAAPAQEKLGKIQAADCACDCAWSCLAAGRGLRHIAKGVEKRLDVAVTAARNSHLSFWPRRGSVTIASLWCRNSPSVRPRCCVRTLTLASP